MDSRQTHVMSAGSILLKKSAAVNAALADSKIQIRLASLGSAPLPGSPPRRMLRPMESLFSIGL